MKPSFNNMKYTYPCSLHNKGVYIKMGLRKMMNRRSCMDLHRMIRVEMDGNVVDLPPLEGIIVLNILRYCIISGAVLLPCCSTVSL